MGQILLKRVQAGKNKTPSERRLDKKLVVQRERRKRCEEEKR